jgi:pimeloyl-ACP methyl ester carboxylesterase
VVVPPLARSRRVITLDVPGFGQSAPAGPGFELGAVAARIAAAVREAGVVEPFDLVGHSLGAGIALTLATDSPGAVRRLVLVAPAGLAPVHPVASLVLSAGVDGALWTRRKLAALTDLRWGRRVLLGLTAADPSAIAPTQARMMIDASDGAQRTAAAFSTITGSDLRPLLARVGIPLGVIWGSLDRTVPIRHADAIRGARPDADVVVIERAGHVAMVERPDTFVEALEGLLERLPKDATSSFSGRTTVP